MNLPNFLLLLAAATGASAQQSSGPLTLRANAQCFDSGGQPAKCRLGSTIVLEAPNLPGWMAADTAHNKTSDLLLVLDGRVMKGLTVCGPCTTANKLIFTLSRLDGPTQDDQDNRAAWTALLSGAKRDRTMNVGVALKGSAPCFSAGTFVFSLFPDYSWLIALFMAALLLVFLYLAHKSDILRDPGPDPGPGNRRSFSLARSQMAFWFFIVLAGFNFIWMVIGDHDSLTQGVLILTGISAATGLGSAALDSSKQGQRQSLQKRRAALTAQIAAAPPPIELAAIQQQLADVNTSLNSLPAPPAPSEGFFQDILSDESGVSFHRFQMAAWTVVLGFVFVVTVTKSLAMPDFSPTLLGLMGISAGTFIGFKIPDAPK